MVHQTRGNFIKDSSSFCGATDTSVYSEVLMRSALGFRSRVDGSPPIACWTPQFILKALLPITRRLHLPNRKYQLHHQYMYKSHGWKAVHVQCRTCIEGVTFWSGRANQPAASLEMPCLTMIRKGKWNFQLEECLLNTAKWPLVQSLAL